VHHANKRSLIEALQVTCSTSVEGQIFHTELLLMDGTRYHLVPQYNIFIQTQTIDMFWKEKGCGYEQRPGA